MAQSPIELLNKAAEATRADPLRHGNIVQMPPEGSLVLTGDIHGHRRNFERIVHFAALEEHPDRHVVLHEVIHGGPEDGEGGCLSYRLLFEVARYKLEFPGQVHTVMGNHDTALISDSKVMKSGKEMNRAMRAALQREFGGDAEQILAAIREFLFSQPLGVKTCNRIWMSHSLPSDRLVDRFDPEIFERPLTVDDIARPGSAYILTWGRRHSQSLLDRMASLLDADFLVLGHQPQDKGWCRAGANVIILACDHNHGCILPVDLSSRYDIDELSERILPLTSIA